MKFKRRYLTSNIRQDALPYIIERDTKLYNQINKINYREMVGLRRVIEVHLSHYIGNCTDLLNLLQDDRVNENTYIVHCDTCHELDPNYSLKYVRTSSAAGGILFSYEFSKDGRTIKLVFDADPVKCYLNKLTKKNKLYLCQDLWEWHKKLLNVHEELSHHSLDHL
jgi:hypothetical protein